MALELQRPWPQTVATFAADDPPETRMRKWMAGVDAIVLPFVTRANTTVDFLFQIVDVDPDIGVFSIQHTYTPDTSSPEAFYMILRDTLTKLCVAMKADTELCHFVYVDGAGQTGTETLVVTRDELVELGPYMSDFLFFRLLCVRRRQLLGVEIGFVMLPEMWAGWVASRFGG